jgi:benzoyl-CoA reductase subunit B
VARGTEKQLESTRASAEHQKAWFADLRRNLFDEKKPYAIAQADMPLELFQLLGVPVVSNQWWSAVVAAKQLSGYFFDELAAAGYHDGLCRYCSLSMASSTVGDRSKAPWGGLPRPALLAARLTCDCIQRVFQIWAAALDTDFIALDNPGATHLPSRWWELSRDRWQDLYEPHRLDLMTAQMRLLIRKLEKIAKRKFDEAALRQLMEGVNRQEEYFDEVRTLICAAPQTPVRLNEQVINVMNAQWHRGSEWAMGHARAFRDEVRQRVERGIAAYPGEKFRLMWVGAGLWHDADFYTAFEETHGAVFVWSMYLAFGPDGYIRYGLDDPLRALASRIVSMNEQLHNPPWANEWIVEQARRHRIDAALVLMPQGSRPSATGTYFIERALEAAGIPTLEIAADMVDARKWDGAAARERVTEFLDSRVSHRV